MVLVTPYNRLTVRRVRIRVRVRARGRIVTAAAVSNGVRFHVMNRVMVMVRVPVS